MEDDDPHSASARPSGKRAMVQSGRVVQIIALVKPFRAQAVLAALESVEILGGTVREAMGYGRQKNRLHQYLGSEYNTSFVPKVELTVFVEQEHVQAAIKAIVGQARTGRIGDGKILVVPCCEDFLSW
jgi:nitrogen regulatory protein PII